MKNNLLSTQKFNSFFVAIIFVLLGLGMGQVSLAQVNGSMGLRGDINTFGETPMTYRSSFNSWIVSIQAGPINAGVGFLFSPVGALFNPKWASGSAVTYNAKTTWFANGANSTNSQTSGNFYTYIIRDVAGGTNSDGYLFQTSAAPVSVSTVTQSPISSSVTALQPVVITATTSANLPTGQGVFLRYTTDNFVTSTIVNMTGSSVTYTATIPGATNSAAAAVKYYVFTTGGTTSPVAADADLATINLNSNGGLNYSYTVNTPAAIYFHAFEGTLATPYTAAPNTLNVNLNTSSWTTSAGPFVTFAGATGNALSLSAVTGTQTYALSLNIAGGFSAAVTSFSFWSERSSTGPSNWSMTINGISAGSGTVSVSGAVSTVTPTTNVIAGQTGTLTANITLTGGTGGTFRLDDFVLNGNLVIHPGPPALTTPTAIVNSSTAATLGATVTSNGGAALTARGTSYKTSSPVVVTDNQLTEGGTTVAAYTHSRTGLTPQTQYFYAGYATNANGTSLSPEGNFRTFSNPPTAQPATFTTTAGSSSLTANWGTGTFPASGATQGGYVVIYATGTPTFTAANGNAPTAGVGTLINITPTILPTTPALTTTVAGLINGTLYNLLLVPYTWDGTNASTYNYLTVGERTTTGTPVGLPTLTTPTAAVTSPTAATLGATVTSNGGAALTARGTSYKTSSPVVATDNQLAEGGTTVAAYTHSRTGLLPQTQYFYAGYATNSVGTSISSEGNFRTFSNPPTAQPATFTTTAGSSSLTANWGTGTFPASGATQGGYVVIYATGTPTFTAANGNAPTAGVGTLVNITPTALPTTPALITTIAGLINGTLYNLLLVPYTWDGTNASTYNYLTAGERTTTGTPAAASYTWIGGTAGTWATTTNWSPTSQIGGPSSGDAVTFNTGGAIAVSSVPATSLSSIALANSGTNVSLTPAAATSVTVTLSNAVTALNIAAGTTLNLNGNTTGNFTLAYSSAGTAATIAGKLNLQLGSGSTGAGKYTATNSTTTVSGTMTSNTTDAVVISATSNLIFSSTGKFELIGTTASAVPTATWNAGSLLHLSQSGSTAINITGLSGQTFSNVTVDATHTGTIVFNNSSTVVSFTIAGNYIQSGTPLIELGSSSATTNISIAGNFQKTGGSLSTSGSAANGTLTFTGTTALLQCNSSQWTNFIVSANAICTLNGDFVTNSNSSTTNPTSFTVNANGTLNGSTFIVSGSTTAASNSFVLVAGGTLGIGSTAGITTTGNASGNIQTVTRTFNTTGNYVYNGTANQVTGTGLPATVNTLTINNTGVASNNTVTLTEITAITATTNSLRLQTGFFDLNSKQLTIPGGGTVASTGGDFTVTAGPVFFIGTGSTAGTLNPYCSYP